ncbi:MAG TPA: hypothetical protein VM032_08865 [Vicinamibacterales bacterium]|nr:hypothetical protein [Vicinamibacterales bacterium]
MKAARAAALSAALLATSCGAPLLKLPAGPGVPVSDGADLLEQATAACSKVETVSTEIAVSGSVNGGRVRGRLLAGLAAPDSLYMEAPAPFGAPLFVLGASRGDATLLLPRDRRVLEHGRPEEVLGAITGVPLSPADLRSTLTGCAAAPTGTDRETRAIGADWRIVGTDPVRYLRRGRGSEPWRLVAVTRAGADGWRADYGSFLNDLPRTIRLISNARQRFDLRLELSQVELNVQLEPSTFRVAVPAGTPPISLEELRAGGPLSR